MDGDGRYAALAELIQEKQLSRQNRPEIRQKAHL
jgi:hypothetical protein